MHMARSGVEGGAELPDLSMPLYRSSWDGDMFTHLEALQTPLFRVCLWRFYYVNMVNLIIGLW